MKKISFPFVLLLAIIIFASFLRLVALSAIPNALNPDELAIGYNSYALLTTGADEWGNRFPLALKSFGDWKLPIYPVITMLPIKLLGLTEFAVRIPSALAGIISVALIYGIAFVLFKKKWLALVAALFLAISPWGIFLSRGAFEPNVALTLFLGGLYTFLLYTNKERKHISLFSLTAIFWGLTLFTYHGFVVFTPLFFIGILLLYRKDVLNKKIHSLPILVFCGFVLLSGVSLLQGSSDKASTDTIFHDAHTIYTRAERFRTPLAGDNHVVNKLLYNRYAGVLYQMGENYLMSFSPTYLFDMGGQKNFYNMEGFGPMYLLDSVLLVLGLFVLVWKKEQKLGFIFFWLLLAPIPSTIATTAPSQTRLIALQPVLLLIEAYGVYFIGSMMLNAKKVGFKLVGAIGILLFVLNFVYFLDMYYYQMNLWRARFFHYGYKQIVEVANKYPNDRIVVRGPENFSYISFLFYTKYDPERFRKEVTYYPKDQNGFYLVKSFGKYSFVNAIDRARLQPNTLYFDYPGEKDQTNLIFYPTGDPVFVYFDNTLNKKASLTGK